MNIIFKDTSNIKKKNGVVPIPPNPHYFLNDKGYKRELLKLDSKNLHFKGSFSNNVSLAVEEFGKKFGASAQKYLDDQIKLLSSAEKPLLTIKNNKITFKKITQMERINQAVIEPIINFPVDWANSLLTTFKKNKLFKDSSFINNLLDNSSLKARRTQIEYRSHAVAIEHYFEMFNDKKLQVKIFEEGHKRLDPKVSNYSTKAERGLTRFVTGIIPAFFLANDAYNLSIYVNDNQDLAQKEKKRRFMQEIARVTITAAATFGFLGYFAKKSNAHPETATKLIALVTFASEIIGRIIAGTPFYPIGENMAKKYAKLQNKDKSEQEQIKNKDSKSAGGQKLDFKKLEKNYKVTPKEEKNSSFDVMKLLAGMVIFGFAAERLSSKNHTIGQYLNNSFKNYMKKFDKDILMPKKEFDNLILKLKQEGFEEIANNYTKMLSELNVETNGMIKIGTGVDKVKNVLVNEVLALPIKFAWEILMMPYRSVVKPLIDLSLVGIDKILTKVNSKFNLKMLDNLIEKIRLIISELNTKKSKKKTITKETVFQNGVQYLRKIVKDDNFKEKVNKNLMESFDNVNKSNFSNADLSGSAKVAVSTVTSGFLIADNYNLVMIDSQGKDKKLAEQKAKERTIQRIVRIAYGAVLIKLFNGIFRDTFNRSLLGAQVVNAANTLSTETLERTSVGLPLVQSTKEDIIRKDEENLHSKGFKGFYYRFMSKLTGKKSIAEKAKKKVADK
jgi:hypothetical protein